MACTMALFPPVVASELYRVQLSPDFERRVPEAQQWLRTDEAQGEFYQYFDGTWTVDFTDANTAFHFRMRFT